MKIKHCTLCDKQLVNVHHSTKYCSDCKKKALKNNQQNHYDRHKENKKFNKELELIKNFQDIVNKPFHLTGKGFNKVSKIKCKAYTQYLDKKWVDILKDYNCFDDLVLYIVESYKDFINETGKINLHEFAKWNKYCSYDLLIDIGIDLIKEKSGIAKRRYSDEDYIKNFQNIINTVGNPPLYSEFISHSKIQLNSYASKFNLKGKIYSELMRLLLTDEQFEIYLERYINHKSETGRVTGILSAQFTDEDYESEFHRVFNYCINEYGDVPSRRLFEALSKFDTSQYRRKYNKGWLEICEMYGYEVERNHKLEKMVLRSVETITGCTFVPQKTWDWLIGVGGKNMYCDGYFPKLQLVVEFDGVQHRKPIEAFGGMERFIRLQENDKLKEELLNQNNIRLLRIGSNEKWYNKEFLTEKLAQLKILFLTPTN